MNLFKLKKIKRLYYHHKFKTQGGVHKGELKINANTKVNSQTSVGSNFNSNGLTIIGKGAVVVGDNFHCGFGCIFITEHHNYKGNKIPYDETYIIKSINIGDNVWLGVNVIILPGISIGEGAIIQAGSVVSCDIPKLSISGGNPAKPFSQRDETKYYELKSLGRFH